MTTKIAQILSEGLSQPSPESEKKQTKQKMMKLFMMEDLIFKSFDFFGLKKIRNNKIAQNVFLCHVRPSPQYCKINCENKIRQFILFWPSTCIPCENASVEQVLNYFRY